LIHIENLWAENYRTVDGELMHERTHNEECHEKRGNTIISRGMRVHSFQLGISGNCDVVEFHRTASGLCLKGEEGLWCPFPVEYKHGEPKENSSDAAQLCAQALCLEEMLCCDVRNGALFYGKTKRRFPVEFTADLRKEVMEALKEMHALYQRGYTPKTKPTKACHACSLQEVCLPVLMKHRSVREYMEEYL
jgi:CRISPR-associated exonuclease Cas4